MRPGSILGCLLALFMVAALSAGARENTLSFRETSEAALDGQTMAQSNLGKWYYAEGRYKEAHTWLKKAAEKNYLPAKYNLAFLLEKGLGTKRDYEGALKLYLETARSQNHQAMHNLAMLYARGRGVERNYPYAMYWLKQSADRGNAEAQLKLGRIYMAGKAVTKDLARSHAWYTIASLNGSPLALRVLKGIKSEQLDPIRKASFNLRKGDFRNLKWGMSEDDCDRRIKESLWSQDDRKEGKFKNYNTYLGEGHLYLMSLLFVEDRLAMAILTGGYQQTDREFERLIKLFSKSYDKALRVLEDSSPDTRVFLLEGLVRDTRIELNKVSESHLMGMSHSHGIKVTFEPAKPKLDLMSVQSTKASSATSG